MAKPYLESWSPLSPRRRDRSSGEPFPSRFSDERSRDFPRRSPPVPPIPGVFKQNFLLQLEAVGLNHYPNLKTKLEAMTDDEVMALVSLLKLV